MLTISSKCLSYQLQTLITNVRLSNITQRVLGCALDNKSHNFTLKNARSRLFPERSSTMCLVYFPAPFFTIHTLCFIISVCWRLNRAQGLNGFASSVCIPVGKPYSTCPRISFSHSFLHAPMSLSHKRTHANCQTRPNIWILCEAS